MAAPRCCKSPRTTCTRRPEAKYGSALSLLRRGGRMVSFGEPAETLMNTIERSKMTIVSIRFSTGELSTYIATPEGAGPWPGVVVIHDALGMSEDLHAQADWLASEGYLAAAPDLFGGGTLFGCLRAIMRDFNRGEGPFFDRIEAVRQWLLHHEQANGKVGVIGFCFGGGFALLLAPRGEFDAASVNYGGLPKNPDEFLKHALSLIHISEPTRPY